MPVFLYPWIRDSRTCRDRDDDRQKPDADKGLDEEVLIEEDEGDEEERDVNHVVGDIDLDSGDDRDDVTDPHEPPCGHALGIDEEAEADRVEHDPEEDTEQVTPEVA